MTAKIVEMFHSIQGEGKYIGATQVFVRFFECNIHCVWCDTPHSIGDTTRRYKEYSLEDLTAQIKSLWPGSHSVSLTGGEPLVQADFIAQLLPVLQNLRMPAYLETNGILPEALAKVIDRVDIVAMDIKLPSSTQCPPFWKEHEEFIRIAKRKDLFLKVVVSNQTTLDDVLSAVDLTSRTAPEVPFILQPNYFDMKDGVISKCVDFQKNCSKYLSDVRIIPQVHKFMKLR